MCVYLYFFDLQDICILDTVQFYTTALSVSTSTQQKPPQQNPQQKLSTCVSLHDQGVTFMITSNNQSSTIEFPLRAAVKILKDNELPKKVTLMRPNGAVIVLEDERRDLLVQFIYSWLNYK
jgi:hypothetical protein